MLKKAQTFYPHFQLFFFILISSFYLNISLNIQNRGPKFEKNWKDRKQSTIFIKVSEHVYFSTGSCCINFRENRSLLDIQNGGPKSENWKSKRKYSMTFIKVS